MPALSWSLLVGNFPSKKNKAGSPIRFSFLTSLRVVLGARNLKQKHPIDQDEHHIQPVSETACHIPQLRSENISPGGCSYRMEKKLNHWMILDPSPLRSPAASRNLSQAFKVLTTPIFLLGFLHSKSGEHQTSQNVFSSSMTDLFTTSKDWMIRNDPRPRRLQVANVKT